MRLDHTLYSAASGINYHQIPSPHLNSSSWAIDRSGNCSEFPPDASLDFDSYIHGGGSPPSHQILDYETTPGASNDLVTSANNGQMTVMECGNYQDIRTGNGLDPNGQFQAIHRSENYNLIQINQPLMNPDFVAGNNNEIPSVANVPASGLNSQPTNYMKPQFPQNTNTCSGPFVQMKCFNEPLHSLVSQQRYVVSPISSQVDPAVLQGILVGASQQQNLENNHEIPGLANSLASLADKAMEAGSEPQFYQHKDIPFNGSGTLSVTVPRFAVEIPKNMPFDCWKGEILKKVEVVIDNMLDSVGNIELSVSGKVTIGKKRARQTVSSNFEEHDILKRKNKQGTTENDFPYDTKMHIVEEPHVSMGILCPSIKNSTNALWGEIPMISLISRKQTAPVVIQKSTCIALSPQLEVQNLDSMDQVPESSQPRRRWYSLDETELLINAVHKYGTGRWQEIKHTFFHKSNRTCNDLKDKWKSLVKTAHMPSANRRGPVVPQWLLNKVLDIASRNTRPQGMPLQPHDGKVD